MAGATAPRALEILDRPKVLEALFHPRPEPPFFESRGEVLTIPSDGVEIGGILHTASPEGPTVLFFHGNGEIAADYEDLAPQFLQRGLSFFAVDYRGYGRSSGSPSVGAMLRDARAVLAFTEDLLASREAAGPLLVMGRSLGTASALELAAGFPERIKGLILESGFVWVGPLLRLLGLEREAAEIEGIEPLDQLGKIRAYAGPTLIIHAERDHIIPFSEGHALFQASPAADKQLLKVPRANHNDILFRDLPTYMQAVRDLADKAG